MSSGQHGMDTMAYRPTSLDFINRPNPVEPNTQQEKHPLNVTPRLGRATNNQDLVRSLLVQNVNEISDDVERPAKRQKSGGGLDLPSLPVRISAKRLRIPPTLSGLHQPPPDAGILPSMSMEQPRKVVEKPVELVPSADAEAVLILPLADSFEASTKGSRTSVKPSSTKPKRNKWSEDETACLLKGVARFGIGNWTKILNCKHYDFPNRTALDLKDRFRVCCPDDYVTNRKSKWSSETSKHTIEIEQSHQLADNTMKDDRTERKTAEQLGQLGINTPFEKSKRRRRTQYTPAEDEALLQGFQKHGNSWASIRQDVELHLSERTAMDLRDRFRTRYPNEYKAAGLTVRSDESYKPTSRKTAYEAKGQDASGPSRLAKPMEDMSKSRTTFTPLEQSQAPGAVCAEKENKVPTNTNSTATPQKKAQPPSSLFDSSDVFWGYPLDGGTETDDVEPPTLDRRILDYFPVPTKTAIIDPLTTLNLPNPSTTATSQTSNLAALPSLADVTAGPADDDWTLPSLLGLGIPGAFAPEPLRENHFPGWDELLS